MWLLILQGALLSQDMYTGDGQSPHVVAIITESTEMGLLSGAGPVIIVPCILATDAWI